jgi:hypothetical protein
MNMKININFNKGDMKRIRSGKEGSLLLSSSHIGSVRKCGCCDSYHLSLGSITLRLHHSDMLILTEMLIEALEFNILCENKYGEKNA